MMGCFSFNIAYHFAPTYIDSIHCVIIQGQYMIYLSNFKSKLI
jgi:hypothetical protein